MTRMSRHGTGCGDATTSGTTKDKDRPKLYKGEEAQALSTGSGDAYFMLARGVLPPLPRL